MNVSIIICTYNRAGLLAQTLKSLEQLDVPTSVVWEVLVVDNNSSDSTRDVVTDYVQSGKLQVRYVFESRQGLGYARNRGINESKADILVFTDDDVLLDPHWLKILMETFERYDCAGVGGRIFAKWDFPKPGWLESPGMERYLRGPIVFHDLGDDPKMYDCSGMPMPVGANMAFRREVFERRGLFRADLGRTGKQLLASEDTEFCQRLLNHGEQLIYCANAIVYHPVEPHRVTKQYFRRWMWGCGRSLARMEFKANHGRTLFGVPFWQYRDLMQMVIQYLGYKLSLDARRRAFELKLIRSSGMLCEKMKQSLKRIDRNCQL